jgi:O-methyltransferase
MTPEGLYLHLMKRCLTYYIWGEAPHPVEAIEIRSSLRRRLFPFIARWLSRRSIKLMREVPFDSALRTEGRDHPQVADTMIGLRRLDNLQDCIEDVLRREVPGDLIETGVWRGGATIFMRAVLKAYQVRDRKVWVIDSFEGLPRPNAEKYPADADDIHYTMQHLAVSLEGVQANFAKYGLLDDQVCFLKGWFKDVLPDLLVDKVALMRLDGDMYESTMDALTYLYPKLSRGGYVIIDDYGYINSCRQAVHDFRAANQIEEEIRPIDWSGVYWQRSR